MKPINLILLAIGGYVAYKWYQNYQATQTLPSSATTTANPTMLSLPGVAMSVPETTGQAQVVPTPATIMPLSVANGSSNTSSGACSCCISGGNINKQVFVI